MKNDRETFLNQIPEWKDDELIEPLFGNLARNRKQKLKWWSGRQYIFFNDLDQIIDYVKYSGVIREIY